jgi:hypothetical protein
MKAYSIDWREKIVKAYEQGDNDFPASVQSYQARRNADQY